MPSSGSIERATAGSPTQPRPRLVIVMPTWVAAMNRSGAEMACLTPIARLWPSAISWSIRVLRTVTIANSAATKNPLVRTSTSTAASRPAMSSDA